MVRGRRDHARRTEAAQLLETELGNVLLLSAGVEHGWDPTDVAERLRVISGAAADVQESSTRSTAKRS